MYALHPKHPEVQLLLNTYMPFSFKTDTGADGLILAMTHSPLPTTAAALALGRSRPASRAVHAAVLLAHDPADPSAPFAAPQVLAEMLHSAWLHSLEGRSRGRILSDPDVIALVVRHGTSGCRTEAP